MFPTVELVTLNEKIGVVQATQLHFAGADVTLRVSNTRPSTLVRDSSTNPIWLSIKDNSLLMRHNNPVRVPIPSLHAGVSQIINVHLDAILPPPTSQLPEEKQYAKWSQDYRDRCGLDGHHERPSAGVNASTRAASRWAEPNNSVTATSSSEKSV